LPPVSSKAKDYTERPEEVVDELNDLRVRGIAKVLNKHFTTTTKELALEKAEADAALADLERRRAQTKAFVPSKGGELNPYDQMYFKLQQRRAECRRKEKETMLLYQRYVMKYGKSAQADPLVSTTSFSADSKDPQDLVKAESPLKGDQPGKSALGTLDENSEITFSKFYEKQRDEQERIKKQNSEENAKHFASALNKFMTVQDDDDGPQQAIGVPELVPSKDSSQPSPASKNTKIDPFMTAISKFTAHAEENEVPEQTKSSILVEADDNDKENEIQSDTVDAADLVEPNTESDILEIKKTPSKDALGDVVEDESLLSQQQDQNDGKECFSPKKTAQNGHSTTSEKGTKIPPANPDIVPEVAAVTLSPSSQHSIPKSNKFVGIDVNESPGFHETTVEGYDCDDRSIISELTQANSAVTRQLMDEVETEMEDFIKFEMESIRKMLDSEEDASTIDPSLNKDQSESSSLQLADQSMQVAMKAEAMVRDMQKILDDFAKEDSTSLEGSTSVINESIQSPDQKIDSSVPTNVYPYKFEPAIPGEDWYVHFDDNYQKEFYVERKSTRTQWTYPQKVSTPHKEEQHVTPDEFLSDMHSVASSRRSLSRRSSRRSIYRKQRKKRRARRLMVSFLALLCVLVSVFCWRINHPGESITGALTAFAVSLKNMNMEDFVNLVIDRYEYSFTDRKMREEEEFKLQQEQKSKELAAQLAAQRARDATKRAKEEANRIAKEKAAREEAERVARAQEAARQLATRLAQEERERERLAQLEAEQEEEEPTAVEVRKPNRHKGCNVPFAYIIPHCWRLAKTNPIFGLEDENSLVFLQ